MGNFKRLGLFTILVVLPSIFMLIYSVKYFKMFDDISIWTSNIHDVLLCLLLVVIVLTYLVGKKVREKESFISFAEFEDNVGEHLNNEFLNIEVVAQYFEVYEFRKLGFKRILEYMHKINIINRSVSEVKKKEMIIKHNRVMRKLLKLFTNVFIFWFSVAVAVGYVILFILAYIEYYPFGYDLGFFLSAYFFIVFVFSIIIIIVELARDTGETYLMKNYKEKRKSYTYLSIFESAYVSKDFVVMGEFASNIEKVWAKDKLSEEEFAEVIINVYNKKDEIDTLYIDYLTEIQCIDDLDIDKLDKFRKRLKSVTKLSLYKHDYTNK